MFQNNTFSDYRIPVYLTENAYFLTDLGAMKSVKGGNCFPVKDDFSKDLYFDLAMLKA